MAIRVATGCRVTEVNTREIFASSQLSSRRKRAGQQGIVGLMRCARGGGIRTDLYRHLRIAAESVSATLVLGSTERHAVRSVASRSVSHDGSAHARRGYRAVIEHATDRASAMPIRGDRRARDRHCRHRTPQGVTHTGAADLHSTPASRLRSRHCKAGFSGSPLDPAIGGTRAADGGTIAPRPRLRHFTAGRAAARSPPRACRL